MREWSGSKDYCPTGVSSRLKVEKLKINHEVATDTVCLWSWLAAHQHHPPCIIPRQHCAAAW